MPAPEGYGPRRRRDRIAWLLDWAAGLLIAILLSGAVIAVLDLFIPHGPERTRAMMITVLFTWPIGAPLGVWLSAGRPLSGRRLASAYGVGLVGAALLLTPIWLLPEASPARTPLGIAALIGLPMFARLGLGLGDRRED